MNGFALAACIYIASAALRDPRESSVELMSDINEGCQCDGEVYSECHPYETDSHNPGHLTVIGGVEMCPNEFWDRDFAGQMIVHPPQSIDSFCSQSGGQAVDRSLF
jgi:hypothetical protein